MFHFRNSDSLALYLLLQLSLKASYPCHWCPEYANCTPSQMRCPGYDTKLHLIVRLQFWRSGKCGEPFHCHYSQFHAVLEW